MFSTGFSSGAREGRKIGVMFSGTLSWLVVCHPALSSSRTACAPLAWRRCARFRRDGAASCRYPHKATRGPPQRRGRARSRRTDGVVVALVGGLPWPRSTPGPLADEFLCQLIYCPIEDLRADPCRGGLEAEVVCSAASAASPLRVA